MPTFGEVQDRALHDDFDPSKYRTVAAAAINEALGRIFRTTVIGKGDTNMLVSAATGSDTVALPGGILRVAGVWLEQGWELVYLEPEDFARYADAAQARRGTPTAYTVRGGSLALAPTPDRALTLELVGRVSFTPLVNATEPIPLPEDYAWMPMRWARAELFALEDDQPMSDYWRGQFEARLVELRGDVASRTRQGSRQVPGTWSGMETGASFRHPQGLF